MNEENFREYKLNLETTIEILKREIAEFKEKINHKESALKRMTVDLECVNEKIYWYSLIRFCNTPNLFASIL